jgi:hypothetical protein
MFFIILCIISVNENHGGEAAWKLRTTRNRLKDLSHWKLSIEMLMRSNDCCSRMEVHGGKCALCSVELRPGVSRSHKTDVVPCNCVSLWVEALKLRPTKRPAFPGCFPS